VKSSETSRVNYLIYGKEVAETTGTPHLQGHVYFAKQTSAKKGLKMLGVQAHMSPARLVPNSIECCKKEGNCEEFGTPPTATDQPGKPSDLEDFKAAVKSGQCNRVEL